MNIFGKSTIEYLKEENRTKDRAIKLLSEKIDWYVNFIKEVEGVDARRRTFEYLLDEKVPKEFNERKNYMSDIAMFYRKIFKSKLDEMISAQKDVLATVGPTEKQYEFHRATINAFHLLDDWLVKCEREHLSNLQEARQAVEDSVSMADVDSIKNKYNK